MSQSALYFPYINVPSTSWTTQAILYWDKLASIVPSDHLYNPDQMEPLTRSLLSEGLVEPVMPGALIQQAKNFDVCFMEYVEKRLLPNALHRRKYAKHDAAIQSTRIHAEKMGRIPDYLVELGLARRINWAWFDVDTVVANHFMAYLATVLGALPTVRATPITNNLVFSSMLGAPRSAHRSDRSLHTSKARQVILKALLPVPDGPIDADQLVRFKQRHGALLPQLRSKIEAHCGLVSLQPDPEARAAMTSSFIQECQDQVSEIEAAMRPAFGKVAYGSLAPLFGAGLTMKATDQGNAIAYAGAALSLVGAAYLAIASIRDPRRAAEARPLAYIAHARRTIARA